MALALCRECGRDVSTEASSCPHCGVPNPSAEKAGTAAEIDQQRAEIDKQRAAGLRDWRNLKRGVGIAILAPVIGLLVLSAITQESPSSGSSRPHRALRCAVRRRSSRAAATAAAAGLGLSA